VATFAAMSPVDADAATPDSPPSPPAAKAEPPAREKGGPEGPEPTRYGDWEKGGRCIDF
jgi:hypothetical protein